MTDGIWQASDARQRFSELVDAAVEGHPQFVQRRDGREVVVVSREYYEQTKPNLKSYLLTAGYADDEEDDFDIALRSVRRDWAPLLNPGDIDLQHLD